MTSLKRVTAETWPVVIIGLGAALRIIDGDPWFGGGLLSVAVLAVIGSSLAEQKPRLAQAVRRAGFCLACAVVVLAIVDLASAI